MSFVPLDSASIHFSYLQMIGLKGWNKRVPLSNAAQRGRKNSSENMQRTAQEGKDGKGLFMLQVPFDGIGRIPVLINVLMICLKIEKQDKRRII